jgi:hypothetical protein
MRNGDIFFVAEQNGWYAMLARWSQAGWLRKGDWWDIPVHCGLMSDYKVPGTFQFLEFANLQGKTLINNKIELNDMSKRWPNAYAYRPGIMCIKRPYWSTNLGGLLHFSFNALVPNILGKGGYDYWYCVNQLIGLSTFNAVSFDGKTSSNIRQSLNGNYQLCSDFCVSYWLQILNLLASYGYLTYYNQYVRRMLPMDYVMIANRFMNSFYWWADDYYVWGSYGRSGWRYRWDDITPWILKQELFYPNHRVRYEG